MMVDSKPSVAPQGMNLPEPARADVGFLDAIGPAFRTENIVGSTLATMGPTASEMAASPKVNPWDHIEGTEYEQYFENFIGAETQVEVDFIKSQIERENADRRVIDEAGWGGIAASLLAGVVDIPSLIPGGAAFQGVRGGATVARVAGRTALVAGAEATAVEGILQAQQQTRTAAESATAIGGSVILGGILGGAAGAILARTGEGRAAYKAASRDIDQVFGNPVAAGADIRVRPEMEDFALPTKAAESLRSATPGGLSYTDRLGKAKSPVARQYGNDLIANEYAFEGTDRLDMQPSVEAITKVEVDRYHATIAQTFRDDWKAHAKDGGGLTKREFSERVAAAMRRGDEDGQYPEVSRTAQRLRESVIDPLKDQAIKLGKLPEDVNVTTAASYFTRMWDQNRIVARSDVFLDRLTQHFKRGALIGGSKEIDMSQTKLSAAMGELQNLTDPARASSDVELNEFIQRKKEIKSHRAKLAKSARKIRKRPMIDRIKELGGIDPQGMLASELKSFDIHARTQPGLFRRGGLKDVDNLEPLDGLDEFIEIDGHYLSRQGVIDRIVDEASGNAALRQADALILEELDALDEIIEAGTKKQKDAGRVGELARIRELAAKVARLSEAAREAEIRNDLSPDEIDAYARLMAEDVYNTLTNAETPLDTMQITVKARGPLKERTLNVADVEYEDFLENDAEFVLNRYSRIMAAENELTQRFGRADMRDQIKEIHDDYAQLRDAATSEKERVALDKEMKRVIRSVGNARDMVRGTYLANARAGGVYRTMQAAMSYNYIRALGDVVLSSLPDVFKITMSNGIGPVARDALVPMMTNLKKFNISRRKAGEVAGIAETLLNSRLMQIADITDPYATRTPIESFTHAMSAKASTFSGMMHWNQYLKEIAAYMAQNRMARMMKGDLSQVDQRFLKRLKINSSNWEKIKGEMEKHGSWVDKNIYDPGTEFWAPEIRKMYSAAIRAEADTTIVTPGVGDKVPLIEENWGLKPAQQFKSFALASHRKTLMVGMQDSQARFLQSAILMASMGMFVYWLKAMRTERGPSDNPGTWLAEGIDRTGMFPLYMEVNNMLERLGAPGAYYLAGNAFGGSAERASRYQVRSIFDTVGGPSAGLMTDTAVVFSALMGALFGGDVKPGDVGSARRLVPFGNHPGIKDFLNLYAVPELKEAVQ